MREKYYFSELGGTRISQIAFTRIFILSLLLLTSALQRGWAQSSPTTRCGATLEMYDSYGDGWNNAMLSFYQHDSIVATVTMNGGGYQSISIDLDIDSVYLYWQPGYYDGECSFCLLNDGGDTLFSSPSQNDGGMNNSSGLLGGFMMTCATCPRTGEPYLIARTTSQLVVGWNGTPGSTYRVEYAPYGTSSWTATTTSNNSLTINGLAAGQLETVRVRRICSLGDTSGAKTKTFMTPCDAVGCSYTVRLFDRSQTNVPFSGGYIIVMHKSGAIIDTIRMPENTPFNQEDYYYVYDYNLQTCVDTIAFSYHTDSSYTPWGLGIMVISPEQEELLYVPVQEIEGNNGLNYTVGYYCPTCLAIKNLDGHGIDSVRAAVSWNPNGGTQFVVKYGPTSDDRSTYTSFVTTDTALVLTGLAMSTQYAVIVRNICGMGDTSSEREIWVTTGPRMKGSVLYVSQASYDSGDNLDGSSWANAYHYVNDAVLDAWQQHQYYGNHPEVWVAEGTYYPRDNYSTVLNLYPSINVYGGFAGNESADTELQRQAAIAARDFEAHASILRAYNSSYNVVGQQYSFPENSRAVMDGFVVENGYYGGYFYSNALIRNCTFRNNQTAVSLNGNSYYGRAYMERCIITNNQNQNGNPGIIAISALIANCLVANNRSQYGDVAGLQLNGNCIVYHCDIVGNQSASGYGVKAENWNDSYDTIFNSIVWNNRPYDLYGQGTTAGTQIYSDGALCLSFCATNDMAAGTGNIRVANENNGSEAGANYVNFFDPDGGDFRLNVGSACIDAVPNPTSLQPVNLAVDLAGNSRPYGNGADMGCYESDGTYACLPPMGLSASEISESSATIAWSSAMGDSFTLQYAPYGSDSWTTIENITSTQYRIENLTKYTRYKVRVSVACSDATTLQSNEFRFRTACYDPIEGIELVAEPGSNYERTAYYTPVYLSYANSGSYILIKAEELGNAPRMIDSIGFQFLGNDVDRDWRISIYNFSNNYLYWSDTTNLTDEQVVFRGRVHLATSSDEEPWSMIGFDSPFMYNGLGNIVIKVMDTSAYSSNWAYFKAQYILSYNLLYTYGNYYYGNATYRPYIYLAGGCDMDACPKPRIALDSTGSNGAMFSCSRMEGTPLVEYKLRSNSEYSPATNLTMGDSSCWLWGLQPNSDYDVRFRRICPSGDTSAWVEVGFSTAPIQYSHVYVKADAIGAGDGTTWSNAFTDLSEAIATAYRSGQYYGAMPDVRVAAGVYYGDTSAESQWAFTIREGIDVYGGFAGDEPPSADLASRDLEANASILDGRGLRPVLVQEGHFASIHGNNQSTMWDGFTIRNGASDNYRASVHAYSGTTLKNTLITNCRTTVFDSYIPAALYSNGAHFENCTIANCSDDYAYTRGILFSQYSRFTNCSVIDNTFSSNESIFQNDTLVGCTISGNSSISNIAHFSNTLLVNSLISDNLLSSSGSYAFLFTNSKILNCDIVGNRIGSNYYPVVSAYNTVIANSILWNGNAKELEGPDSIWYCAIKGGYNGRGNINLTADNLGESPDLYYPTFVMPEEGDYRLAGFSPCVDAAQLPTSGEQLTTDIAGNARPYGNAIDMGCYEYSGESFCLQPYNLSVDRASTAALVTWSTPQGVTEVDLEYRQEGDNDWTVVHSIADNHFLIDGLATGQSYQVRLQSRCEGDSHSSYSNTVGFVTACTQYGYSLVGDSTSQLSYSILPTYSSYYYGYSQQLFLASELSLDNSIKAIQLQASNENCSRRIKVYMGHTTKSSFSSGYDAVPGSELSLVFDGTVNFSIDSTWSTIPLNSPFAYNDIDNLVVAVLDYSGFYSGYSYFGAHYTNNNMALYHYGYNAYNVDSTYIFSTADVRNNVRFVTTCVEGTCPTPLLSVQNITDTSARVVCQTALGQRVQLQYRRIGDESYTALTTTAVQQLGGLRQNSVYQVRARTICLGDTSRWNSVSFRTNTRRQQTFYVSADGNSMANGTSWQDATNDLNWAVATAKRVYDTYGDRAQVWVQQGTYYGDTNSENAFEVLAGVDVYGGFAGYESSIHQRPPLSLSLASGLHQSNESQTATVLDGQGSRRVLYQATDIQNGDSAVWDGFTICNGNAENYPNNNGGGALLKSGAILSHCIVKNCKAEIHGGGIYMSSAKVLNCMVVDDSAYSCGGIFADYGSTVANCLIANNSALNYSGIYMTSGTLANCNIVANRSYDSQYCNGFDNCQAENSLFWGNKTASTFYDDTYQVEAYHGSFLNCAFEDEWPRNSSVTNCILLNGMNSGNYGSPMFAQPSYSAGVGYANGSDWALQQGSILIDRGGSAGCFAVDGDLAGNARVQSAGIDIGCYESPYSGIVLPTYNEGRVYVVEGGAGRQDGTSWSNATGDINTAITMAATGGALEVWVAQGTYYGNTEADNAFTMFEGINLYGGFEGNETSLSQRQITSHNTLRQSILDGANNRRVLRQRGDFGTLTVWDGFTLQNGFTTNVGGAAATLFGGSQLRNCIIQNNIVYTTEYTSIDGGAIKAIGVDYSVEDTTLWGCTVRNNYIQSHGQGHQTEANGIAIYAEMTNIVNCLVYGNRGDDAAVVLYYGSNMFNSVVSNNQGRYCAGMKVGYNANVFNSVVAQNISEIGVGGVGGSGTLYNSIVWGNKRNYESYNLASSLELYNCAVEGGYDNGTDILDLAPSNDGTNGSLNYVRFIDPTQNDFRLHSASHCIDHGDTTWFHLGYALDGSTRIVGAAMDLGAYESETSASCPSPVNLQCTSLSGNSATFTWSPQGDESQWRFTIVGVNDGLDSTVTVVDTTLTIGNLQLNHTYTACVRAICGSTEYSAQSPQLTISTLCDTSSLAPLSAFSGLYPADSSIVIGERVSFSWNNIPEATSYDFYIWRDDQLEPTEPSATGISIDGISNYMIPNYRRGNFYHWKVVAWNQCIKRSSPVQTFELDPLPDLHVTDITFSQPVANQPLTVTWTVRNDGRGATPQGASWRDHICIVSDVDVRLFDSHDNQGRFPGFENLQGLAPGESYTNSVNVVIPPYLIGNYYIFAFTDQWDAYNINFSETGGIAPDPYTPSVTGVPYHYLKGSVHQGGDIPEVEENDNFFYKSFYIMPPPSPDLKVTHISHPTQAFSNSDISIQWTVTNIGDAQAGGRTRWFDDVYIQMGDEFNLSEATKIGRVKHWAGYDTCWTEWIHGSSDGQGGGTMEMCYPKGSALQPDSSYSVTVNCRIPIQFAGEYSIFVVTDATDTIYESIYENNNRTLSEQHINVIMTPLADLEVSNVSMPLSVSPRQLVSARWTVTNSGAGATERSRWYDILYLSPTPTFDSSTAIRLTEKQHNGILEIDGSYTDSASFYIPKNKSGNFYLIVKTDSKNEIFENLSEENNYASSELPIEILLPDLRVTRVIVPEIQALGENVTVSAWIKNIGPGTAYAQKPIQTRFAYSNGTHIVNSYSNILPGDSIMVESSHSQGCPQGALASVTVQTNYCHNGSDTLMEANGRAGNIRTASYPVIVPDVEAVAFSTSDSGWSGKAVNATWTIVNSGNTMLHDTIVSSIYISGDPTMFSRSASNRLLSEKIVTNIMPDSSISYTYSVPLPNGISGDYYLHLVIDTAQRVCEAERDNNVAHTTAIHISLSPWPDLVVESIMAPDSLIIGGAAHFDIGIANNGIADAIGRMTTKVYMSLLPIFTAGTAKEVASQQSTLDLGVNETTSIVVSGIIPTTVTAGHYYFYAITDYNDNFYEHTGEDNNTTRSNQAFVQTYPLDLIVDTIIGPDTLCWGQTAKYVVCMRNNSNVISSATFWFDRLYFNSDGSVSSNIYSGIIHTGGLEGGASYKDTFMVTMPYGVTSEMTMTAICDYNRKNPDIAPLNNQLTKSVAAKSVPTPDLQMTAVELLDSIVSGQPFRLAYSVKNISSTAIDSLSWNDRITLSDVNGYTSWSMQISLIPQVGHLDSGYIYRDTVSVTIPVPNQGSRFLIVHANAQNSFYEADQTNNFIALPVSITLPPPGDLTVTNITNDDSVLSNTTTTVSWCVRNIGNNNISGQRLSSLLYLSRDNIFSSDDKLLGSVNTGFIALAPGDSVLQQATVTVSGEGEGNRYIIVKTDVRNAFYEDDESNNTVAAIRPVFVKLRTLPFNTTVTDTLYAARLLDYKLDVGTKVNETVRISLQTVDSLNGAINNIYVSYNNVGNSLNNTYSTFEQYAANPELFIPSTRYGYYGVSLEGSSRSLQPQIVQLRADILPFELRSINPNYGGTGGEVTVELKGSRFRPDMDVWMERNGDTLRPVDLVFVSYYQAYAKFNLNGADTGQYNMGLLNFCEGEVSLDSAFHISAPSPDGLGYNILFPNSPRPNRTITMILEFGNIGNTDIENAVLEIESVGGTYISLTSEGLREHGTTVQVPLNIPGEPEGLLRPGSRGTVTIYGYTAGSIVLVTRRLDETISQ